jgi:glycosyltransferase involved in cell wall biosynthesis
MRKFVKTTLLTALACLCVIIYFPFFSLTTFKADRTKQYPDLSMYGVDQNYNILFNAPFGALSDKQATNSLCLGANNLGIDCHVISFNFWSVFGFQKQSLFLVNKLIYKTIDPNLVIYTHPYLEGKKHKKLPYKTYIIVISATLDRINKYNFDYDGYLIYGEDSSWFESSIDSNKIISGNYIGAIKKDFAPRLRNYLVYSGSNWDPKRGSDHYRKIFELLDKKKYFYAYGEKFAWKFLKNSYKGYDDSPDSFSEKLSEAGISLTLHGKYHWQNNEPSSARIFEAAAAGNVIISDNLPIIMKMFGDSIFYIDPTKDPEIVAKEIDDIVQWVKSNPSDANNMARKSYDIFVNNYTSERTILNIIKNTQ